MSGGHFEYENHKIAEWAYIVKQDTLQDEIEELWKTKYTKEQLLSMNEFSIFLKKVGRLVHSYDYAICGDTNMDDFKKDWEEFKNEKYN